MKRTITLMTAARAKGAELPAEWFARVCKCCFDKYTPEVDAVQLANNCWCGQPIFPRDHRIYIGPDLERPENIHHAFTVADALADWPVDVRYIAGQFDVFFFFTLDTGEVKVGQGTAPERHLALVAACEAALGIKRGEVGV